MGWKFVISSFLVFVIIVILLVYWFIPLGEVSFGSKSLDSNFSLNSSVNSGGMQFYENMRFPSHRISYKISDECSLRKQNDMEKAFEIVANQTILNFYPVNSGEEISVFCDEKHMVKGGLVIAGEGGPTEIVKAGSFNVILSGEVSLLKDFSCPTPNVGIHELFHAIGFNHSTNPNNIMYSVADCKQTIGQDVTDLINSLYSIKGNPDLVLEDVSAVMKGKYLDVNMTIRNNGLQNAGNSKVVIYTDDKIAREVELEPMQIGFGTTIRLSNIWVFKINVEQLKFAIEYGGEELDKNNNELVLMVENN